MRPAPSFALVSLLFFCQRLTLCLTLPSLPPPSPLPPTLAPSPGCVQMNCMSLHSFFLNYLNVVHLHSERAKKSMRTERESVRPRTASPADRVKEWEGGGEPLMNESSLGSMKTKRKTGGFQGLVQWPRQSFLNNSPCCWPECDKSHQLVTLHCH